MAGWPGGGPANPGPSGRSNRGRARGNPLEAGRMLITIPAVRKVVAIAIVVLSLGLSAFGQTTFVWTGLGADSNISTPGNWQGGVAPTGTPTDVWAFPELNVSTFLPYSPQLTAPLAVDNLQFLAPSHFYGLSGTAALTLHGDIAVYSNVYISTPLVLTTGSHVVHVEEDGDAGVFGSLWLGGEISGNGTLVKTGAGRLIIDAADSQYSGGTIINGGTVEVHGYYPLAFGTITFNEGTIATSDSGAQLGNDFLLGANVTFSSDIDDGSFSLGNGDNSSIAPIAGVTNVNIELQGRSPLWVQADFEDGSAPTTFTFSGETAGQNYFVIAAGSYHTGGTVVSDGASVLYHNAWSIPQAGLIRIEAGGYAGLWNSGAVPADLIAFVDAANSSGTIGFDNDDGDYEGDIDLSDFNPTNNISIGTRTGATLLGEITPPTGGDLYFRSSGRLYLDGLPLVGDFSVTSSSFNGSDTRGMLVLSATSSNDFTGTLTADGGAVVFDSEGSLPEGTSLSLGNGGYISFTELTGLDFTNIVDQVGSQFGSPGVIGIDRHDAIYFFNVVRYDYASDIDLGALSEAAYIGTSSHVRLQGDIFTSDDGTDGYYLTGYDGGTLEVSSLLTGNRALYVGLPEDHNSYSSVTLWNEENDYTGGTTISSGVLFAPEPTSIGTGPLAVDTPAYDGMVSFNTNGTVPNDIHLNWGTLNIVPDEVAVILSGTISGAGRLAVLGLDEAEVTLAGNNSYEGGSHFGDRAEITATSNTALGTGSLNLTEGAAIHFTSPNPVIGTLAQGSSYFPFDSEGQKDAALLLEAGGLQTLTIVQDFRAHFQGAILQNGSTTGAVVLSGGGTLSLGGGNVDGTNPGTPYSGGTTINDGTLIAASATAVGTGTITLNGPNASLAVDPGVILTNPIAFGALGGVLGGTGTFASPISVGPSVILAPGDSPGVLTFTSGLTLAGGGSLEFEIQSASASAGVGYDLVSISTGTLAITATPAQPFTILLTSLDSLGDAGPVTDFSAGTGYSWILFEGNGVGGISGFAANKFNLDLEGFANPLGGGVFSFSQGVHGPNPAIYLHFSPVPEPSTYALLAMGAAAIGLLRRRRS
jgi:autotransporter-associated beta strand protein